MPPKTNEDWVEEFDTMMHTGYHKDIKDWLRTLLTERDKQKEEAVAEERERLLKMFDEFNDEIEFEEMAQMVRRFIQALTQPIN